MDKLDKVIQQARESMQHSIDHLSDEMGSIRAGRANTNLVNNIAVEAYGSKMPLNQTANISTPDAKTIMIKPWDKSVLEEIEKAIMAANIGLTPQNDGEQIHLNIPPLTEERRKELVKQVKALGEEAKVSVRNVRRDAINEIQKIGKDENVSEVQDESLGVFENLNLNESWFEKVELDGEVISGLHGFQFFFVFFLQFQEYS